MISLINGDCIEELKKMPDKSVDFFYHDLPYTFLGKSETNCHWDKPVNLELLWKELKRVAKHDRVAYVFSCSTKFGYELIKSNPKLFRMDLVWVKRNKTGGIYSRYRPMKNHEMVYFFYKKAPKYNRDKYHKRIRPVGKYNNWKTKNSKGGDITYGGTRTMKEGGGFTPKTFDPPNPASVLVLDDLPCDKYKSEVYGVKGKKGFGATYTPPNPASVIETDIYGETKEELKNRNKKFGREFDPPNPASVIEEKTVYGMTKQQAIDSKAVNYTKTFDPPNPASVIEPDKNLPNSFKNDNVDYKKKQFGYRNSGFKDGGGARFNPKLPVSVYEFTQDEYDEEPKTAYRSKKVFVGKRNHQTEKPLDLMEFLLKYWTDEGDLVVDSCMGSGTMGLQCKKMNRSFIGVEKNKKIYDVAVNRVNSVKIDCV